MDCLTLEDGASRSSRNVSNYSYTLHNSPEERRSHLWRYGSPKLHIFKKMYSFGTIIHSVAVLWSLATSSETLRLYKLWKCTVNGVAGYSAARGYLSWHGDYERFHALCSAPPSACPRNLTRTAQFTEPVISATALLAVQRMLLLFLQRLANVSLVSVFTCCYQVFGALVSVWCRKLHPSCS